MVVNKPAFFSSGVNYCQGMIEVTIAIQIFLHKNISHSNVLAFSVYDRNYYHTGHGRHVVIFFATTHVSEVTTEGEALHSISKWRMAKLSLI